MTHALTLSQLRISIHAPRVRCDANVGYGNNSFKNFNPRTSCEVRRKVTPAMDINFTFQSTHLV